MIFVELEEYKADIKALVTKYPTLRDDLGVLKKVLEVLPAERDSVGIIRVKKFACRSIKGKGVNSGFRLVYAYIKEENKIVLVEVYHEKQKQEEDKKRVLKYFHKKPELL